MNSITLNLPVVICFQLEHRTLSENNFPFTFWLMRCKICTLSVQILCISYRGYYMATWRCEIYLRVLKNISLVRCTHSWNIFQHEKINFVSPSDHVIFFLLYKMWRFSEDFQRFSKIGQNVGQTFPNIFRRLPKTTEDDPKMFRSYTNKFKFS